MKAMITEARANVVAKKEVLGGDISVIEDFDTDFSDEFFHKTPASIKVTAIEKAKNPVDQKVVHPYAAWLEKAKG